ncbi:MAG TPA: SCO family protein [Candidatus Angelobacter sp.]|nr:SCO family protein [Candidatus Angelobacter sp.]
MRAAVGFGLLSGALTLLPANVQAQSRWGANYFPNTTLTTQDGDKVHFYDDLIKGKIVVIDLIYTTCVNACPLETARLVQVQKMLGDRVGKDIFFYSISIDPKHDTPKVLKAYAEKYHVGPGWTFLTGKKDDIDSLSKKLGLYTDPDPNDPDGHTPSVLLGNEPMGQWMRDTATDNPRFLTNMIGNWLNGWKNSAAIEAKASYDQANKIDLSDKGRYVFAKVCAACHTIGHGDRIGPDLLGVTNVRDRGWLARFISEPDKMVAEKDPIAIALYEKYKQVNMPNLRLAEVDLNALLNFLHNQDTTQHKDQPAGISGENTIKGNTTETKLEASGSSK